MSPKRKNLKLRRSPPPSTPSGDPARATTFLGRDGLGAYIKSPETFPPSRVIYHNEKFVVINDLYPKASLHLLILPRDETKVLVHPFDAFEDAIFLEECKAEVEKVKGLAAKELKRRFGKESRTEQLREKAMTADEDGGEHPPQDWPPGRAYTTDLISGIHAGPSMNHLHIHILSKDRHSECMRHRKHYNSFSTDFFVPLDAFPLAEDDPRRRNSGRAGYLNDGFKCWRCGREFGNRFQDLKKHLEVEFEAWKKD